MLINFSCTLFLILIANVFLKEIVVFFIHEECDLLPLRLFLIGPLLLSVSYVISNNLFVAFGYNKYLFTSMLFTTCVYLMLILLCLAFAQLNTILAFICISLISYVAELIYRLIKTKKIIENEKRR